MKISEIIEKYGNEAAEIEVYRLTVNQRYYRGIHTDVIKCVDDYEYNDEAIDYELMDEEEYDNTVLCNTCVCADFAEWYGDNAKKVLVIIVK